MYIANMPEWKRDVGRALDDLIVRTVPKVQKAVRWNSPFYGVEGQGWFISYHVFARYVKVTFLKGKSLDPMPPIDSKDRTPLHHIFEEDGGADGECRARRRGAGVDGFRGGGSF